MLRTIIFKNEPYKLRAPSLPNEYEYVTTGASSTPFWPIREEELSTPRIVSQTENSINMSVISGYKLNSYPLTQ